MDNDFILQEFQQTEIKKPIEPPQRKKPKPLWREYLEVIFISLAAAIILRLLVVSAYRVESISMEDTLAEGDYIFIKKNKGVISHHAYKNSRWIHRSI